MCCAYARAQQPVQRWLYHSSNNNNKNHFGTFDLSCFFLLLRSYFSASFGELLRYYEIVGIELEPQLNQRNTQRRMSKIDATKCTDCRCRHRHRRSRSNQKNVQMYVKLCVIDIHIRRQSTVPYKRVRLLCVCVCVHSCLQGACSLCAARSQHNRDDGVSKLHHIYWNSYLSHSTKMQLLNIQNVFCWYLNKQFSTSARSCYVRPSGQLWNIIFCESKQGKKVRKHCFRNFHEINLVCSIDIHLFIGTTTVVAMVSYALRNVSFLYVYQCNWHIERLHE